jgi:hypothetical protein
VKKIFAPRILNVLLPWNQDGHGQSLQAFSENEGEIEVDGGGNMD